MRKFIRFFTIITLCYCFPTQSNAIDKANSVSSKINRICVDFENHLQDGRAFYEWDGSWGNDLMALLNPKTPELLPKGGVGCHKFNQLEFSQHRINMRNVIDADPVASIFFGISFR